MVAHKVQRGEVRLELPCRLSGPSERNVHIYLTYGFTILTGKKQPTIPVYTTLRNRHWPENGHNTAALIKGIATLRVHLMPSAQEPVDAGLCLHETTTITTVMSVNSALTNS